MALIEIDRQFRKSRSIPLTPLVDVLCCLLIFFMLSTSFIRTESMELSLPSEGQKGTAGEKVTEIYVSNNGEVFMGDESVNLSDLPRKVNTIFEADPDRHAVVYVADQVNVQTLVTVIDKVYMAGGRNVSVADWMMPGEPQ